MPRAVLILPLLVLSRTLVAAPITSLGWNFNAVIFGSLSAGGGDTEGRLLVGGNAVFPNTYSVGVAVIGSVLPASSTRDDLIVFGGLTTVSNWGVNGNAVVGGSITGPGVTHISPGAGTRIQPNITIDPVTGNALANGTGLTLAQIIAEAIAVSAGLGALADQGVVTKSAQFGTLTLVGSDPLRNVFNITAADFANLTIDITAPASSTVIINVGGAAINASGGSITLHNVSRQSVLFNFSQATSLSMSARLIEGSFLAPLLATTSFSGGGINGQAILGGNIDQLNGFEFHNFRFNGDFPPNDDVPVPEPSADLLVGFGLLAVSGWSCLRAARHTGASRRQIHG